MNAPNLSPVLVIDLQLDDLLVLQTLLRQLHYPSVVACTAHQALRYAQYLSPSLMILANQTPQWTESYLQRLRTITGHQHATLLLLGDQHDPHWLPMEDNPGLDGFLVKPLSYDVLASVMESTLAKQVYQLA